jgi:HprK-related kinase A
VRIGLFGYDLQLEPPHLGPQVDDLYGDYPTLTDADLADFTVGVRAPSFARRLVRPQALGWCDQPAPFVPLPAESALVVLEMAMNWQTGMRTARYLVLHAAVAERDGKAIILPGDSGAGKSTLSACLAYSGWRFLADEFALIDPDSGLIHPYPRPISLKNASIDVMKQRVSSALFTREFPETAKGRIAYLRPPAEALARMAEPARPVAIVYPRFVAGAPVTLEPLAPSLSLLRFMGGAPSYARMGVRGFNTLTRLISTMPSLDAEYGDSDAVMERLAALVEAQP